jgi:D-tyrosyl-tRNA(Tyr) deacylase
VVVAVVVLAVAVVVAVAAETKIMTLPTLGVGIGFREPFRSELFLHQPQVDFLEIVAEHYLDETNQKEQELELLALIYLWVATKA